MARHCRKRQPRLDSPMTSRTKPEGKADDQWQYVRLDPAVVAAEAYRQFPMVAACTACLPAL